MDYEAIDALRERHAAWRLLRAGNASLILSFLGEYFVDGNRGACSASDLSAALDDHLYAVNADASTPATCATRSRLAPTSRTGRRVTPGT